MDNAIVMLKVLVLSHAAVLSAIDSTDVVYTRKCHTESKSLA